MQGFTFFECPECEFTIVLRNIVAPCLTETQARALNSQPIACPMCAGDSGHDVTMKSRPCREDDKRAEGRDDRYGAR